MVPLRYLSTILSRIGPITPDFIGEVAAEVSPSFFRARVSTVEEAARGKVVELAARGKPLVRDESLLGVVLQVAEAL